MTKWKMTFWSLISCSDFPTDKTLYQSMTLIPKLTFTESQEVAIEWCDMQAENT